MLAFVGENYPYNLLLKALELNGDNMEKAASWVLDYGERYIADHPEIMDPNYDPVTGTVKKVEKAKEPEAPTVLYANSAIHSTYSCQSKPKQGEEAPPEEIEENNSEDIINTVFMSPNDLFLYDWQ